MTQGQQTDCKTLNYEPRTPNFKYELR